MTRRVVITAPDITASGYSGMGLRALGLAAGLGLDHDVRLLVAGASGDLEHRLGEDLVEPDGHARELAQAEVVITSNALRLRQLATLDAPIISDLYDPGYFEWLTLDDRSRRERVPWMDLQLRALRRAVALSEVVLCANERQRDLYLGAALARRPLDALTSVAADADIAPVMVVPNGVSATESARNRREARRRLGIDADATIFLWGGGVWDWMDPEVVVRAAQRANAIDERISVVFLGLRRGAEPDPHARAAEALLLPFVGVRRGPVLVNESWVTPDERLDYLAAADAGVLGQRRDLETHFSFRTRLIDCLQAGLPVLATTGDALSDEGSRDGWALTSPEGDAEALAANMLRLAREPSLLDRMRERSSKTADRMSWPTLCEPLRQRIADMPALSGSQRRRRLGLVMPAAIGSASTRAVARLRWTGDR